MKKHLICLVAIVIAIASSSFTFSTISHSKTQNSAVVYQWWYYNGGLLEQCDPYYYSIDYDNIPDCPIYFGLIYCEILALPSEMDPNVPDLSTIVGSRMRQLL